jgi:hypothetical protein
MGHHQHAPRSAVSEDAAHLTLKCGRAAAELCAKFARERTEAFIADFEADLRHSASRGKHLPRAVHAQASEKIVWPLAERSTKQAMEMEFRKAGLARRLLEQKPRLIFGCEQVTPRHNRRKVSSWSSCGTENFYSTRIVRSRLWLDIMPPQHLRVSANELPNAGATQPGGFACTEIRASYSVPAFSLGKLNDRSSVFFGSSENSWSRHSQRIISGRIAPPIFWPCLFMPHA